MMTKRTYTRLSESEVQKLLELYTLGFRYKRIASQLGCHPRTVRNYIHRLVPLDQRHPTGRPPLS